MWFSSVVSVTQKKQLALWTCVWEDLKCACIELILEECVGIDTPCRKGDGETGNFLSYFAKQKRKNIYYFINVLELSAVMFYSLLHVNHSNSWVTEVNARFTLGMRRQVSFEWWKNSVPCYKMTGAPPWRDVFQMDQTTYGGLGLDQHLVWLLEEPFRRPTRIEIHPWPPQHSCLSEIHSHLFNPIFLWYIF